MDVYAVLLIVLTSFFVGFFIHYFFSRRKNDGLFLMTTLTNQLAEIKARFDEAEKLRETFDLKRDREIKDTRDLFVSLSRVISGTKTRGIAGEEVLGRVLSKAIEAGLVRKNVAVGNGVVEFAWDLKDGKFIPIDSKVPDIYEALKSFDDKDDVSSKKNIKRDILAKIKKHVSEVEKYKNQHNTIDKCVLVVPDSVIDLFPESVFMGESQGVFVCSPSNVFVLCYLISEQYQRLKETNNLWEYQQIVDSLFAILKKISEKSETIDRAISQMKNANDAIKLEVSKGSLKRNSVSGNKKLI